ncbi:MAG: ATP-binding protein [Deltaproteobacteria bacterium]
MTDAIRRPAVKDYTATLEAYLGNAGELALERAYEFGRRAASEGMSLLQFAELHHAALRTLATAPGAVVDEVLTRGEQFFSEGLSAFELNLRAHRASARLLGLSDGLTRSSTELSRARVQLKAVLDATPALVYLEDAEGRLLFVNAAFERLFGVSEAQILGKTAHEFSSGPNAAMLQRDRAQVLEARVPSEFERTFVQADGPHTYRALAIPLCDDTNRIEPNQGVYAICSIATDITREKHAAETLGLARQATEAANRQLESMGQALADQLLAPLRSIDGFTQALLEDCGGALDAQSKSYLSNVRRSAQRMATLIDSLLALAKLSRGELRASEVDLTDLASSVAAQLRQTEPDRRVSFEIQPGLKAQGDPRLFGAVLQNLLGNSWKFTRRREHAEIVVGQSYERGLNVYFVKDNGTGFDMAHSGKLFSVFETLHSRREFDGNGVGLATVQRIVNRHGGRVWAESVVDRGATFYFTIGDQLS